MLLLSSQEGYLMGEVGLKYTNVTFVKPRICFAEVSCTGTNHNSFYIMDFHPRK